ncbi:hypothetical protein GLOTRDRAFT_67547 [Gloeophyllum trabeum ATCC 11539]|uniref:DUF7770 domain-containing protein n=1 Tax=Gloeophyllum trabeum (strain ATCC 11539 / FP-39264 / Madison 617) TaxID=670483 RepID=S7S2X3_GLOTA|nr:uncharacterized protein GLOTRDRAFT_67547 [Gloeophyllum trabeum ATCC 11539]EPQ60154.1 hypothetical protein GLOTRDRAFT_67547 [Gloeophyllum trabeum ATCC 11539]
MPVSRISVRGTETPDGEVFHFILALVAPKDEHGEERCITLNNSPSYTDPNHLMRGVLVMEYHESVKSVSRALDPLDVDVRSKVTAATLCHFLFDEHHVEQYEFNENGQGCRHWCATVLEKLAEGGFVREDIGQLFQQFEKEHHAKWGSKFPMPRIVGSYYD